MFQPFFQAVRSVFGGRRQGPPCCLAVCVDHQTREWAGISQNDIDFLVAALRKGFAGEDFYFDGQEDIDGETRLYFFSWAPERILPLALATLGDIPWCRGSRVLTRTGRSGQWDIHPL